MYAPNKNGIQVSAGDLHGWSRHAALCAARLLPEDYASVPAVAPGAGVPQRILRSCLGPAAVRPAVFKMGSLGHYCAVDRGLSAEHLPLSASGVGARLAHC